MNGRGSILLRQIISPAGTRASSTAVLSLVEKGLTLRIYPEEERGLGNREDPRFQASRLIDRFSLVGSANGFEWDGGQKAYEVAGCAARTPRVHDRPEPTLIGRVRRTLGTTSVFPKPSAEFTTAGRDHSGRSRDGEGPSRLTLEAKA